MPGGRALWIILPVVVLTTVAVPRLREQARLQWSTLHQMTTAIGAARDAPKPDPVLPWLAAYQQACAEFVETHFQGDTEMLVAAGSLASHREEARALLKRAAESSGEPFAWAAYVDALLAHGPRYERLGTAGVDPSDAATVAELRRTIAERNIPTTLPPDGAANLMEAISGWRQADPDNSMPLALEVWCLYGLHQDAEALACWEEAASAAFGSGYRNERERAARRLLREMGMPDPEALVTSRGAFLAPSFGRMTTCGAAAYFEGRRAQNQGRDRDALRWWTAAVHMGRRTRESAESVDAFSAGAAIESSGAAPAWRWYSDSVTGIPGGTLMRGRIFYGPQHAFFAGQAGEAMDADLRDSLVRLQSQTRVLKTFSVYTGNQLGYSRAGELFIFSELAAIFVVVLLLLLIAVGTWRGGAADASANLPVIWGFVASVATLVAMGLAAGIVVALAHPGPISSLLVPSAGPVAGGVVVAVVFAIAAPLVAALPPRLRSAGLWSTWRGNLRRTLPLTITLGAFLYLALGFAAMGLRARWVRERTTPDVSQMERIRRFASGRWDNPRVPPDSWRAERPPVGGTGAFLAGGSAGPMRGGARRGRAAAGRQGRGSSTPP
jgi:hypothetical protein